MKPKAVSESVHGFFALLPLIRLAQLFNGVLFQPGNVRPGNAQLFRHFTLGHGCAAVQSVAMHQDLRLPWGQTAFQILVQLFRLDQRIHHLRQVRAVVDNVHQCQLVAVAVRLDGFAHVDLVGVFFLAPEVHQDLIVDALAGVGGEPCTFGAVEGVHCLYQSDRADGNQFLLFRLGHPVFFDDVCHQPHIVQDQLFPGAAVACRQRLETRLLLLPAQGLAERAGFAHVEKKTEELLEKLQKHRITSEQCMPGGLYGMREATSWQ